MDNAVLHKIGYGLYILTAREGQRDNGCVIDTFMQVTSDPTLIAAVALNKKHFSHEMILKTRKFNISVLAQDAPFEVFEHFGYQSGSKVDKFAGYDNFARSANGIAYLNEHVNAYMSCELVDAIDFGSHTLFKAAIVAGEVLSDAESITYAYYQRHVKPGPKELQESGYCCRVCCYVFEGEVLPEDFICPICRHGVNEFVPLSSPEVLFCKS
ncbi:MAG: flavin reductase [Eggerthellaceae bacterium]|nr:flavin reductase [Eggerthellaceae bacterium]